MNLPHQHKSLSAWHYAALLTLVVLLVYGRVCSFGFIVWDDPGPVIDNRLVNPPSAGALLEIWQQPYFGLYVPISYTMFAAEATIARQTVPGVDGDRANPTVFHLGSLLLHTACVLLVFVLLRRLCGNAAAAFAGSLLFALHPLQVEAVAWISETRGLLCAFFSLLAILGYFRCVGYEVGDQKLPADTKTRLQYVSYHALATLAFVA
ncbi:MAG: hypothetical protein N2B03_05945, partial [Boseongicola sp.]